MSAWASTQAGSQAAFNSSGTALPGSDLELRYTYDYADRRIRRSLDADGAAGTSQESVSFAAYAGDVRTLEIAKTATVSAGGRVIGFLGQVVQRNFYGNGTDEILAVDKLTWTSAIAAPTSTTSTFWTFTDHQNSVRDIVSGTSTTLGQVVEHRQYDSFGRMLRQTTGPQAGATTTPGVGIDFGYAGRPLEARTGLSDNRARWYEPGTGKFINEDPSGFKRGDANLFRYVGNDPLNQVDPSGLTGKYAQSAGRSSVAAAGFAAYGLSDYLAGTKAFFGSISNSIDSGVMGLVTGEAGRQLGERAFQIAVNNNGGKFNGQWGQVAYNVAGQMAGTHSMAEGMMGIDLASHEAVVGADRAGRLIGGLGQFAGLAAGPAGMARSAAGVGSFTNLPGSATVTRVSNSNGSALSRTIERVDDGVRVRNNAVGHAPTSVSNPLRAGVEFEAQQLAELGLPKNTTVWRPTIEQTQSAAFKVIVGEVKYTKGGLLRGSILDATETGLLEMEGGSSVLDSTYQLRLQTYRSLIESQPYTIRTTRPINPTFRDWLQRWSVKGEGIE